MDKLCNFCGEPYKDITTIHYCGNDWNLCPECRNFLSLPENNEKLPRKFLKTIKGE